MDCEEQLKGEMREADKHQQINTSSLAIFLYVDKVN